MRSARLLRLVAVSALVAGVAACDAGPFAVDRVTETRLQPQAAMLLGEGGDPLVVMIGVPWSKDGYCSGQFTVSGTETATEVRVGTVVSIEHSTGGCAGLGTADHTAWAPLRLTSPLGDRVIVRDSDGARLPVRTNGPPG
jgi:hypothetical protein